MDTRPCGNATEISGHFINAPVPMVTIPDGKSILVNAKQSLKKNSPITVNVSGSVTDCKDTQPLNTPSPIVTPFGTTMERKLSQPSNA